MPDYFDTERTTGSVERHVDTTSAISHQAPTIEQPISSQQQQQQQPHPETAGRRRQLPSVEEQRAEILKSRAAERERQVEQWREQSMHLLDPKVRFRALLEECARQEVLRNAGFSDARLPTGLADETRSAYARLLTEAKFLFEERRRLGASETELHQVCAQAMSSFASLYPWGSGIRCDDLDECHPYYAQLCAKGVIRRVESNVTLMTSFTGALACAQAKIQAALRRKQSRLLELGDRQQDTVKVVDDVRSPMNATVTSSISAVPGPHRKTLSSIDAP